MQSGKHPERPEINDPPPSETGGLHGDELGHEPVDGIPPVDDTEGGIATDYDKD
jgi:hypothetical protein